MTDKSHSAFAGKSRDRKAYMAEFMRQKRATGRTVPVPEARVANKGTTPPAPSEWLTAPEPANLGDPGRAIRGLGISSAYQDWVKRHLDCHVGPPGHRHLVGVSYSREEAA
jgi:hypothetical protein